MLLALFRIFWIRNELLWICLIILQKVLARKDPKIAIALETLPRLYPPLIAIDDHYPKGIWFIPPWLFFFQMMLPSFTWPQKLVFYWYQLFLFVKAALNLPNVVFFPTAMYLLLPCFFSVWNQTEDWITNYNFATSTSVFLATDQQKVDERPTL